MRAYSYRAGGRLLKKDEFHLENDTRDDSRYYTSTNSNFRYYTEPRNDIKEKWIQWEGDGEFSSADQKLFALLKRCYYLGMVIVNDVDLKSAYSCLRANPSSHWEKKINDLLGNVLDLGTRIPDDYTNKSTYTTSILLHLKEDTDEPVVINPLPEIVWREETELIVWLPFQHEHFEWHEGFEDYLNSDLLMKAVKKRERQIKKENKEDKGSRWYAGSEGRNLDEFFSSDKKD